MDFSVYILSFFMVVTFAEIGLKLTSFLPMSPLLRRSNFRITLTMNIRKMEPGYFCRKWGDFRPKMSGIPQIS